MLFGSSGKRRKRPISGKGGQRPLKPPFVASPFAAARCSPVTRFRARDLQSEGSGRESPKMINSQKWLGEGAKGLLGPGS